MEAVLRALFGLSYLAASGHTQLDSGTHLANTVARWVMARLGMLQPVSWFKNLFGKKSNQDSAPPVAITIRGGALSLYPVKPERAKAEWQKRRHTAAGTTTVILVDPFDQIEIKEEAADGSPAEILAQAATIDLPRFFANRHEELGLDQDDEEDEDLALAHQEPHPTKLKRRRKPFKEFAGAVFGKTAYLAEISCNEPWQVLAHYPFGNWNDVPPDQELTAVFRDWFERFGAVPALISSDIIDFRLDKPIEDPAVAAKLAIEMYILCPDAVDQGTETTEALASSLLGANVWSFWWD